MAKNGSKVAIIMGSNSDGVVMEEAVKVLKEFGIKHEVHVLSAHRMPNRTRKFAESIDKSEIEVVIAGAGKAAHLPGVIASYTIRPVIGVPMKTSDLGGLDSLFSIVQMASGVPVASVAINGAKNAALLAVQILSLGNKDIGKKFAKFKASLE